MKPAELKRAEKLLRDALKPLRTLDAFLRKHEATCSKCGARAYDPTCRDGHTIACERHMAAIADPLSPVQHASRYHVIAGIERTLDALKAKKR